MIAKDLISEEIPFLKTYDTGQKALSLMEEYKVSHLPIVNNNHFLGLIFDTDIYNFGKDNTEISKYNFNPNNTFVYSDETIYEIVSTVSKLKLSLLPVLNRNNEYLGIISILSLVHQFNTLFAADQPGGIIVLELFQNDYYLSEISQIIESNDAKILSLYISPIENSTKILLTLKINKIDLSAIRQTFERYNYIIKRTITEDENSDQLLENRYNEFMKYLSI